MDMKKGKTWLSPIIVSYFIALLIVGIVLYVFKSQCYNKFGEWGQNVLVEAHGLLFDLFVFGIVLKIYELFRERKDRIERYQRKSMITGVEKTRGFS